MIGLGSDKNSSSSSARGKKLRIFIARQVIALKSQSKCFCRQGRKLTKDLYSWLGRSNKSVVYISMGSTIRSEHLPDKHLQTFEKVRSVILFLTTCKGALLAAFAKVWQVKQQKTTGAQVLADLDLRVIWKRSGESTEHTYMAE